MLKAFIIQKLKKKESDFMMAMLFANKIILGSVKWEQVPRLLKQPVADILIECGCENLITEDAFKPNVEEVE